MFSGLDAGVYEIEYLNESSTPVPPRRRIIVELIRRGDHRTDPRGDEEIDFLEAQSGFVQGG